MAMAAGQKTLLVVEDGVVEGRKVFCNILNYVRIGASSNFGNMLSGLKGIAPQPFRVGTSSSNGCGNSISCGAARRPKYAGAEPWTLLWLRRDHSDSLAVI